MANSLIEIKLLTKPIEATGQVCHICGDGCWYKAWGCWLIMPKQESALGYALCQSCYMAIQK